MTETCLMKEAHQEWRTTVGHFLVPRRNKILHDNVVTCAWATWMRSLHLHRLWRLVQRATQWMEKRGLYGIRKAWLRFRFGCLLLTNAAFIKRICGKRLESLAKNKLELKINHGMQKWEKCEKEEGKGRLQERPAEGWATVLELSRVTVIDSMGCWFLSESPIICNPQKTCW